ncbi:hypothetical protein IEU95_04565 [Hoyosella rhizosphaerae]|uniref:Uncharacterized protein n=1 Tax=Hoyosella rhizosphaerae TaxID=1755582 RepID=A0A916UAZ1_9ACTN|nr:hypothetical protein [Hoyosella rhizosphaerae]MBN4926089.1 hypothetical protein [Hoyosella rhizosphaerae]GGC65669.1 hypothetical protein GCM10011410_17710 [Hoyosella rhizosphaerae]
MSACGISLGRVVGTSIAAASVGALSLLGAGVATADEVEHVQIAHGALDVYAVAGGPFTIVAATNATPGYVCKATPEGFALGEADEYGQAIVGPTGFVALSLADHDGGEITVTCGPRYSEWAVDGSVTPMVLS